MKPFKKLSAYDNVPCEYLSSTSGAGWYLTKEQQDAMERMLEGMSETLIPEIDVAALKSENAKLRELVVALQHCRDGRCDGECPMFTPADNNRGVPPVCEAYGVMRELGIEVV